MSTYKAISSDSHIIEPHDLWEKRIDSQFRDRAPVLVPEGENHQWYCEGVPFGLIGINQQAGLRFEEPEKLTRDGSMDTIPLGGIDPDEHVKDMVADGISGGVLYPSQGLTLWSRVPASDLLSAIFRAYNDHLADFCNAHPKWLKGIALVNVDVVEDAVGELERVANKGMAGAMIATRPMLRYDHTAYARLWAAAQDLDMPISLHDGGIRWMPGTDPMGLTSQSFDFPNREHEVRQSINAMVFGGVFERYPKLKVGAIEFEVAWAPYFMQRMDEFYSQRAAGVHGKRFQGGELPSDYFRSNCFIGFQEDDLGIQMRHFIGVDSLLWGSDYPHAESTFPRSREIIERVFHDCTEEEKAKIVGENTAKLYHFD